MRGRWRACEGNIRIAFLKTIRCGIAGATGFTKFGGNGIAMELIGQVCAFGRQGIVVSIQSLLTCGDVFPEMLQNIFAATSEIRTTVMLGYMAKEEKI